MWHNIETNPPKSGMYYVVREDYNGENIYTRRLWCDGSWQRWNDFVGDWEYIAAEDEDIVAWSTELVPYEGKHDVKVIDFVDTNDVDPSTRWHSVLNDGLPPEGTECIVTVEFFDGTRNVYDSYKWTKGMWRYWSEQYEEWEDMDEEADEQVIAWMPYPDPYEGD